MAASNYLQHVKDRNDDVGDESHVSSDRKEELAVFYFIEHVAISEEIIWEKQIHILRVVLFYPTL